MHLRGRLAVGVAALGFFTSGAAWAQEAAQPANAPEGQPDVVIVTGIGPARSGDEVTNRYPIDCDVTRAMRSERNCVNDHRRTSLGVTSGGGGGCFEIDNNTGCLVVSLAAERFEASRSSRRS